MRKFSSVIFIIILFLVTPVLFLVTSLRYGVLQPTFLKRELQRQQVYQLALDQIDTQIQQINIDPQYPITNEEISQLAHSIITVDWLQQSSESIIDHFAKWLNQPNGTTLTLPINLVPIKQRLTTSVDQLLTDKLPQLQPCIDPNDPGQGPPLCQFAGLTLDQAKEELSHQGLDPNLVTNLLPDTLDLVHPDLSKITGPQDAQNPNGSAAKSAEIQKRLNDVKQRYHQFSAYLLYVWMGYLVLIGLYVWLNATHGSKRLVRWSGVLLFILGLWPLALGVASGPLYQQQVLPHMNIGNNLPADVHNRILSVLSDVRAAIFVPLIFVGVIMVVLGLTGIIGAHWLQRQVMPSGLFKPNKPIKLKKSGK